MGDKNKSVGTEDKSYLYRMRKVKFINRGFSKETKDKWKNYVDDIYREIELACREKLTNPASVLPNEDYQDMVASIIGSPIKRSLETKLISDSVETLTELPRQPKKYSRLSNKSDKIDLGSFGRYSTFSGNSMSGADEDSAGVFTDEAVGLSTLSSQIENSDDDDIIVNPATPPPEEDTEPWVDKRSPYQKFFSLAEYKATRWRRGFTESKPKELLTVQEREEHLYNMIATDFVQWVTECKFKNVNLDETTITELFQVGMETPAVQAMCVQTKELPVVPAKVANIFHMPEKSEMAGLRNQVQWDIKFAQLKERGIVDKPPWKHVGSGKDGTKVAEAVKGRDTGVIKQPRSDETLAKWFSTSLLKKEEKSGEMLWAELEKTKVFKHFCNWMINNEKFKRPPYLSKKGYFKSKYHIDESDMVHVVRMESDSMPIASTMSSARNHIERLINEDKHFAEILNDLVEDIPSLKAFLGFDVLAKKSKSKDKKKKADDWSSSMKPLTEGVRDDGPDNIVHHMAFLNHPEWP